MLFPSGAFDPKTTKKQDMMHAMFGLMLHHSGDERTIVNGVTGFADLTDFGVKHQTFWTLEDLKKSADMMNVSCVAV